MKYLCIAAALACIFAFGACRAESAQAPAPAAGERIVDVDRNGDGTIDGVDVYNEENKLIRRGYDTNNDGVMESYQSYNPNTGLPDVVESDKSMELR
jgi:hypothetical protein